MTLELNSTALQSNKPIVPFSGQTDQVDLRSQLKKYTRSLSAWLQPKTISYAPRGEDTLTYGNQLRWLQVKWYIANAMHKHDLSTPIVDSDWSTSIQFLADIERWIAKPAEQESSIYETFVSVFASMVLSIESVESIVSEAQGDTFRLWIVVNNSQEDQRYAIYNEQWEIIQLFPDIFVDFIVLDRYDRPLDTLTQWSSDASIILK